MNEEDERRRRLEFHAQLERLSAERAMANAEQVIAAPRTRDVRDANRVATIALAIVFIVTIATIVGVIIAVTAQRFGISVVPVT